MELRPSRYLKMPFRMRNNEKTTKPETIERPKESSAPFIVQVCIMKIYKDYEKEKLSPLP